MPEFEAAPFPPMPVLRGAVPGWPTDEPLTSVNTPDAARTALRAETETSVLDPRGLRRLWLRDVHFLLALAVVVAVVVAVVQFLTNDFTPPAWWLLVLPLSPLILNTSGLFEMVLSRALPAAGVVPRPWPARWRWYRRVRQGPVVVSPPAAWPAGSEAYAVLAGVASVESVAPSWLYERIGLSPTVGAQWVAVLTRQGWLRGGGRLLGLERLPEEHVRVTDAGRERLERERARLQALAAR
ncbi:MAG TPA: hypothetical protein VFL10_13100 [Ornithinibacter sp.]|nr:hypothetical protein [Ornithinibacter sp.]